jgi:hypothetical protein
MDGLVLVFVELSPLAGRHECHPLTEPATRPFAVATGKREFGETSK